MPAGAGRSCAAVTHWLADAFMNSGNSSIVTDSFYNSTGLVHYMEHFELRPDKRLKYIVNK